MSSQTKTALIFLAVVTMLGACGVRGALDRPSASADGQPAPQTTADADSGQGRKADTPAKPHQSFVLDGLLR